MSDIENCDSEVFNNGESICLLDACPERAESWVQSVARESGQRVDWHYAGGRANVLFLGDATKVSDAVKKLRDTLSEPLPRFKPDNCHSCVCSNEFHHAGRILSLYGS